MNSRVILLLVAAALAPEITHAKCSAGSIGVWPPAGNIPVNGQFVVDAFGMHVRTLKSLRECDLELVASDHSICLIPERITDGEVRIAQLVLVPKTRLQAGTTYKIRVNHEDLPKIEDWRPRGESPSWRVIAVWDETAPLWADRSPVAETRHDVYGCGTAIGASIDARVAEVEPVRMLATVANDLGDEIGSYLLQPAYQGKHYIGRGMCQGSFQFTPGAAYSVTLRPTDSSGNIGEPRGVIFSLPAGPHQ